MASVQVRIGDFEDGVLPDVCASSGDAADGLYRIRFAHTPGWAIVIALVLFPVGLIVIPFARVSVTGYLPFTDLVQERMRAARHNSLVRLGVLATFMVLVVWALWLLDHDLAVVPLAFGVVGCGVLALMASSPRGSVGGRLESNRRWVRLTDVSGAFAYEYERQLDRHRAERRAQNQPAPRSPDLG